MPTATATETLTVAEVKQLAAEWYRKLDVHAPLIELLPLVAEDAEMKFPEATLHGQAEFEGWYEGVIRIFFDEVHTLIGHPDATIRDETPRLVEQGVRVRLAGRLE